MKNLFYPFSVEVHGFTTLKSLEGIYYQNNIDTYRIFKKWLLFFSLILAIICIVFVTHSDGWVQSLFATLLGGVLSSLVWWISVILTDNMNYRINQIDFVISKIDNLLSDLRSPNYCFVDGMKVTYLNTNNLYYRMINLAQVATDLHCTKEINSDELKLKWVDETDISVQDFMIHFDDAMRHSEEFQKYTIEQLSDFVVYNERRLEGQLLGLKDVLLKRKNYILCGDAPIPFDKAQARIDKAKFFDKIFNHNKKG